MGQRVLETLRGVGEVYAGDLLLRRTPYELSLWIDDEAADRQVRGDAPVNPVNIDGHIDITGIGEAVVLAGPGQLTLRLEDGRRLSFTLTGTGGTIVGRGGFQPHLERE
jgi:hypothetical protein